MDNQRLPMVYQVQLSLSYAHSVSMHSWQINELYSPRKLQYYHLQETKKATEAPTVMYKMTAVKTQLRCRKTWCFGVLNRNFTRNFCHIGRTGKDKKNNDNKL